VEGVMFHQRRALAYGEIVLMHPSTMMPYRGEVPEYRVSLEQALQAEIDMLRKMESWARRSLEELEKLKAEY